VRQLSLFLRLFMDEIAFRWRNFQFHLDAIDVRWYPVKFFALDANELSHFPSNSINRNFPCNFAFSHVIHRLILHSTSSRMPTYDTGPFDQGGTSG
jgi:hypothetical protein